MWSNRIALGLGVFPLAVFFLGVAIAPAQQVTLGTPFHTLNNSFFERNGISWGFNARNFNFSFGSPTQGVPQFGGFKPDAAATLGFAVKTGGGTASFNLSSGAGSQQSMSSQTPSVTLMNGQTGFTSDTSQSPFVITSIPVVGGFPSVFFMGPMIPPPMGMNPYVGVSPLLHNEKAQALRRMIAARERPADDLPEPPGGIVPAAPRPAAPKAPARKPRDDDPPQAPVAAPVGPAERLASAQGSSAGRAAPSVAEARRMHEAEKGTHDREALALFERARAAEEDGRPGAAKVYYDMCARRATGELRGQALAKLAALRGENTPSSESNPTP